MLFGKAADCAEALGRLGTVVDQVLVIDNNEVASPELAQMESRFTVTVLHNANRGGLAGAYNLALQTLRAQPQGEPRAVMFLDQDSDVSRLGAFLTDPAVRDLLGRDDVAAVAPAYCERATGLRGRYIGLSRWRLHHMPRRFGGPRQVAFVINSMTVWRAAALRRIGSFDEVLAIDHVDTEYCLRARQLGLGIWVHGDHEFAHAIGQRRRYRLFGRELQAGGHPPMRRRLIGRNTMYLARRWALREPAFAMLCLMRLAYEVTGIVMAEDDKLPKLAAFGRGVAEGLVMRGRA